MGGLGKGGGGVRNTIIYKNNREREMFYPAKFQMRPDPETGRGRRRDGLEF